MSAPEKTFIGKKRLYANKHMILNPYKVTWLEIDVPIEFSQDPVRLSYQEIYQAKLRDKRRLKKKLIKELND